MIFARMIKADATQRRLYARLDETPDRSRMVLDYASSKPQFEAWSDSMRKASGGKNLGNVRVQHGLEVAGLVEAIDFNDAAKSIDFMIKVTNDDVWNDIEQGVYTGISQGGRYVRRWNDGALTRYTAGPEELSLVDRPCNPSATFSMVKAAGTEDLAFHPGDTVGRFTDLLLAAPSRAAQRAILLGESAAMLKAVFGSDEMRQVAEAAGLAKRDYSDKEREELAKKGLAREDGSYPIVDETDLKDAVDSFGRAKDKQGLQAWITKRAKALKLTDLLPADWEGSTKEKEDGKPMKKGIGDVAQMANLLEQLKWLATCVAADATAERDGSPLPGKLTSWLQEGVVIFTELAAEETKEALTALQAQVDAIPAQVMVKAIESAGMLKAGAAISKANMTHVQAIHDHARDLGADCGAAADDGDGKMVKAAFELADLRDKMLKLSGDLAAANTQIAALQRQPAEGGPSRFAVTRSDDGRGSVVTPAAHEVPAEVAALPEGPDKALKLIRHAMDYPQPPSAPRRLA